MARVVTVGRRFEGWREIARGLLAEGVGPAEVIWESDDAPVLMGLGAKQDTAGQAGHGTSGVVGVSW